MAAGTRCELLALHLLDFASTPAPVPQGFGKPLVDQMHVRCWPIVLKNNFEGCSRDLRGNGIPEVRQQSNLIPPLRSLPTRDSIRSHLNASSSDD